MIDDILQLSKDIRYVALYKDDRLSMKSKSGLTGASSDESDRYEELIVNPTLLKLLTQRGNIDCGGLNFVLIRYGHFFQFILPTRWGHVSVSIEPTGNPIEIGSRIVKLVNETL